MMKNIRSVLVVAALVLIGSFAGYQIAQAVGGQGSANINGGVPGGNVTVERATSNIFTVVLTVGASGITTTAPSPTFTIPAGFTTPHPAGGAVVPSNASEVDVDGEWFVVGGSTCLVTMSSSGASVQVITVDVTTVCTVSATGIITLTYQGKSASAMGATALNIGTAVDNTETEVTYITAPPTITVTDTSVPSVVITDDESGVANIAGGTVTYTFTFSEAVTGFVAGGITVVGGTKGLFTTVSGTVYTLVVTPLAMEGNMTVDVAGGVAQDAGANGNTVAVQSVQAVDTVAPTVAVTMSDTALTVGETAVVTFTFSEAPTGFDSTDVNLTNANGTIGVINVGGPLIQTATFTPTNSITDATNIISVGTDWTDTALNPGVGGSSLSYTVNTTASVPGDDPRSPSVSVPTPPLINITKIPTPLALPAGPGLVTYNYTVSNVGTVPMSSVTVVDNKCTPASFISGDTNNNAKLDTTEVWKYRCATTLATTTTNIVIATGQNSGNIATDLAEAIVVVGAPVVPPLIHLVKVPNKFVLPAGGGLIVYQYFITNPGTVPLSDVGITDNKCTGLPTRIASHIGDLNKNNLLDPGETWNFSCVSNLTQTTTNIGTATGHANGFTITDISPATVVVAPIVPKLPNTGLPPEGTTPWSVALVSGIVATITFLYFARRKQTT